MTVSKGFLVATIFLLVLFGAFFALLWLAEARAHERTLESCPKPTQTPEREQVFYFAANTPISRTVMVR